MTAKDSPRSVRVALARPLAEGLTYSIPPELADAIRPGVLVEVPLGKTRDIGCVVELNPRPAAGEEFAFKLRPISRIAADGYTIDPEIMTLCEWISDYYFCSVGEALAAASMIGFGDIRHRQRVVYTLASTWETTRLNAKQREAAEKVSSAGPAEFDTLSAVATASGITPHMARKLLDAGALTAATADDGPAHRLPPPDIPPAFYDEQQVAFDAVAAAISEQKFGVFLLHGVTGSGKTEVYLRLIDKALKLGRTALCLVPEIALTPQTVDRFMRRFQEEIGVFHSQQTKVEKRALHEKIRAGKIRLVIGARSAAFAPLPNLGIVIIDEEHESSYKQSETPRYHARDVAIMRASRLRIPVLLGSATPSLESYENAVRGKFRMLKLTTRPPGIEMPQVRVVSMGKDVAQANESLTMLSPVLRDAITDRLAKGEQSLLFLNRRGFSNFLMCPKCRWVPRCGDDDIVMTVHRRRDRSAPAEDDAELELFPKPLASREAYLKCHFCGKTENYPTVCPECGDTDIVALGTGTQRIEEHLKRVFPEANILRLDQDAVSGRQAYLKAWRQMVDGEAQIILGTQMIAKGLHLERVSLVGVILADVGLYIPDFRAEERTFSLLMQVSGRAGRTNMGEVLVQTYLPHHTAIQLAARHDYEGFFRAEMMRREKLRFPPIRKMIALTLSDTDLQRTATQARALGAILRRVWHTEPAGAPTILGPLAAPIERLAGRFRYRLLLIADSQRANASLLRKALADREWRQPSSLRLAIDVDPQDLL
ncbi:hypothetical protein BH09SUM1_BH09SUM1_06180 [soil metagenome]